MDELTEAQVLEREIAQLEALALLEKKQREAKARELAELAQSEAEREAYKTEQDKNAVLQRRLLLMAQRDPAGYLDGKYRHLWEAE